MADFGFRGPPGALDGPYGYFHAYGDGHDPAYLNALGNSVLAGTGFKPHTGCRHVHPGVDAALEIYRQGSLPLDEIVSIEIGTYKDAITPSFRINPSPESPGQADFSLPVAVCVALVRGSWYPEDVEAYDQPEIRRLWPMTSVYLDEELDAAHPSKNGCVVKVRTMDGSQYVGRVDYPKGEPENMLSEAEFEAKFCRLVGGLLQEEKIERIFEAVSRLEEQDDVSRLTALATRD
jgi:2-methylcitrate dehydratase PrpD